MRQNPSSRLPRSANPSARRRIDRAKILAEVFAGLSDGVAVVDDEGEILLFNPVFERIWSLMGVPWVPSLTLDDNLEAAAAIARRVPAAAEWLTRHRKARERADADYDLLFPGGIEIEVMERALAERRTLICREVTVQRQQEAELRESEDRYRLLVETMAEGLILLDRMHRVIYANRRFLAWFGGGEMGILGRDLGELTDPDHREKLAEMLAGDESERMPFEIPLVAANGGIRFVLVSAAPLTNAEGAVGGHLALLADVTGLREATERLRQSEARFRDIVDESPLGILTLERDGTILSANPAFRKMAGTDDGDGLPGLGACTPPLAAMMDALESESETGSVLGECRIRTEPPGQGRIVLSRLETGGGGRFLAMVEDITEQRRMEQVLRHTSKLAVLGEMSASLAHEISQPLNIIRLAAENALTEMDDGTATPRMVRDKLETIGSQSDCLREIIDYIQAFSRRDGGAQRCFDCRQSVANTLGLIAPQAAANGIAAVSEIAEAPLPVLGQPRQLEQVLINLLRNAIDAIAEKRRTSGKTRAETIRVTARKAGGSAVIAVADSGSGFHEEDRPRLFDPFFTRKAEGQGTGLGLSISLNLITQMRGRIEADTRPEGGSVFTITLPLTERPLPEEHPGSAAVEASETPPEPQARLSLLVVDDEPVATREIAAFLTRRGHEVATAESGRRAREILAATHVDVLITDLRMPDGNGFDLMAHVAAEYPHIAVVVITGQPLSDREEVANLEGGADVVLRKPVSLRELAETIRKLA